MDTLESVLQAGDPKIIAQYMREHDLTIRDGMIVPRDDEVKEKLSALGVFFNSRQQARKIL